MRAHKLPVKLKYLKNINKATKTIRKVIALSYNISEILKNYIDLQKNKLKQRIRNRLSIFLCTQY